MMWIFRRKPKLQDQALSELAQMFISFPEDLAVDAELLSPSQLDLSMESLSTVEDFLDAVRDRGLDDEAYGKLVLRCGAYVGEVIRSNANGKSYHWLDNGEAVRLNRSIADFGESLGTAAILWDGSDGFSFPLAKVMKFLENGREDSVKFFAQVMLGDLDRSFEDRTH